MVQILERPQSFASEIGRGLGQGAGSFLSQLGQNALEKRNQQQRQQQEQLQRQQEDEMISKLIGEDFSGIHDPVLRKAIVESKLKGQLEMQKASAKQMGQLNEQEGIKQTAQNSFDTMAKLLKSGNLGLGSGLKSSIFGGQTAEDVGQFQSATGGLESILVDMVSRGTLSNARFKYITETLLPKPTDREREIKGKMKALADMLGLDPSELTGAEPSKGGLTEGLTGGKKKPLSAFG